MNRQIYDYLYKQGFKFVILGSGKSAQISSLKVKIMDIKTRYYCYGKYLVVGTAARTTSKGWYYRGYVMKIIEDKNEEGEVYE